MKKLIVLSALVLLVAAHPASANETKKAPAKKAAKQAPVDEPPDLPPVLAPTVADGVTGKQPPAPANKIDPNKPVSPLVAPKGALSTGEPPGGFPKLNEPEQPKGNIDPSKIAAVTVYSYKDDKGNEMFADTLDAVPKAFREKAKKVNRK